MDGFREHIGHSSKSSTRTKKASLNDCPPSSSHKVSDIKSDRLSTSEEGEIIPNGQGRGRPPSYLGLESVCIRGSADHLLSTRLAALLSCAAHRLVLSSVLGHIIQQTTTVSLFRSDHQPTSKRTPRDETS